nr:response regulator [Treponema sp.]
NKTISLEEVLNEKFPCTYDLYIEKWAEKYVKSTAKMDFLANTNRVYLLNSVSEGKREVSFEYPAKGFYGEDLYVRRTILLTTDENTGDAIAYCNTKDITSQKKKELMLANYEKILISTASDMYDGVLQVDLQEFKGIYHYFKNDRIVSTDIGHFQNYVNVQMQSVYAEDVSRVREFLNEEMLQNMSFGISYRINYRGVDKNQNGTQKVYTTTVSKTVIDGNPYALFVKIDSTSAVEAEAEHRKIVENALEKAETANKAKGLFLSNMSHDIRTPMNAIVGFTDLAINNIENKERTKSYLEKIGTASNHLLLLINDILDMSYIESGKIHLSENVYNLFELVEDLRNIISSDINKKQLKFIVDTKEISHPMILCDRLRLDQVLLNLLGNAVKFTESGGQVEFRVIESKENDRTLYSFHVKDTGIGMSKSFMKHIFDPFERERSSTVSGIPGTGLGMAITKRLVGMMKGEITVTSTKNIGSEFIVTLPLKQDLDSGLPNSNVHDDSSINNGKDFDVHGKRILLVEDNELNREIANAILTEAGFEVEEAEDGIVAVEKVSEKQAGYYTVVLMDIQMPVMDGYTACQKIRELKDKDVASVPIIAMTANAFEEDKEKALHAGMNAHISKPVDIKVLFDTLREVIQ